MFYVREYILFLGLTQRKIIFLMKSLQGSGWWASCRKWCNLVVVLNRKIYIRGEIIINMTQNYDLRQPYNNVSLEAMRKLGVRETNSVNQALYGVYCEALIAIQSAISQGAKIGDLEKEIAKFGAKEGRIVKD